LGLAIHLTQREPESIAGAMNQMLADEQWYGTMKKDALEAARIFN
jgi:hypothetical protein